MRPCEQCYRGHLDTIDQAVAMIVAGADRETVKVRGEWSLVALTHNLLKLHAATG